MSLKVYLIGDNIQGGKVNQNIYITDSRYTLSDIQRNYFLLKMFRFVHTVLDVILNVITELKYISTNLCILSVVSFMYFLFN